MDNVKPLWRIAAMAALPAAMLALFSGCSVSESHEVDGYRQAGVLWMDSGSVGLELTLMPDASSGSRLLKTVDADGNGLLTISEQRRFAKQMLPGLDVSLDGQRLDLEFGEVSFSELAAWHDGKGEVRLVARASNPTGRVDGKLSLANSL